MKFALAVSALALAAALGSGASAASLTINSVSGVWQNDLPDPAVTGEGTSSLRWGIPITLTTIVHLVDKYTLLHSDYLPNMGMRSCWFASEWGFA